MQLDEVDRVYRTPGWLRRLTARQIVGTLAIAAFAWLSSPLWLRYFPDSLVYFRELRAARTAMGRLDEFRRTHGGFPSDLCQVGLPCVEDARLGYDKNGDGYLLWFGAPTYGFFGTLRYDSKTKKWSVGD